MAGRSSRPGADLTDTDTDTDAYTDAGTGHFTGTEPQSACSCQ